MSIKMNQILRRLGNFLSTTLIDTETGHRMLRQIYRTGEFDDTSSHGQPADSR